MLVIQYVSILQGGRFGPIALDSALCAGHIRASRRSLRHLRTQFGQGAQSGEVVGGHGEGQKLINLVQSSHHHLRQRPHRLAPAEALLDAFPGTHAHRVALVPRRTRVDGAAAQPVEVLRDMRDDVDLPARFDEALGVVRLVGGHRLASRLAGHVGQPLRGHLTLGHAVGLAGAHVDHQAVAVVAEYIARVARQRGRCIALAVQPRLVVRARFVRLVDARLAAPVLRRAVVVRAILAPHALVARPSLDQRAVNAEVLARQQPALLGHVHRGVEQFGHRLVLDQPVAVLAEHRVVPHRVVDRQAHEPAEQQVVVDLLDQLPLAADAEQHLQQHGAHQLLGRDAGTASANVRLVHDRELLVHLRQRVVHPDSDRAQRVAGRHEVLQADRAEQALVVAVGASHRLLSPGLQPARPSLKPRAVTIGISTAC
jgi:hypothetical protein